MLKLSDDPYVPKPNNEPPNFDMHVVFPTTPAQHFYLLRRQIKRNFRKPLADAAWKGLLRLSVKRVVLVLRKIYYDLIKEREARGLNDDVAFVCIEELSLFPFNKLTETLQRYTRTDEIFYLQEEPKNQGSYTHVASRIQPVFEAIDYDGTLEYRGWKESALPASGIGKLYAVQQKAVIAAAFESL
ncbi:hypothetical protein D9615_008436 [Tricholomella constricta]|nr:hypothetical protein D9615_008436 [Tricholomella constricta]